MKNTYTATFSTGETITRTSHKIYNYASAWVNSENGQIENVTFSAKSNARPQKAGIFNNTTSRLGYSSNKAYKQAIAKNKELEKIWKVETVHLS